MEKEDIDYQKTPPGMHRVNAAERAIGTFKNHLIAGLCTTDKNFPLHLWDHILSQAELTLNMMRGACLNPLLSAHEFLHGPPGGTIHRTLWVLKIVLHPPGPPPSPCQIQSATWLSFLPPAVPPPPRLVSHTTTFAPQHPPALHQFPGLAAPKAPAH